MLSLLPPDNIYALTLYVWHIIHILYDDELWNGSLFASLSTEHWTFIQTYSFQLGFCFWWLKRKSRVEKSQTTPMNNILFSAFNFGIAILAKRWIKKNLKSPTYTHTHIDTPCIYGVKTMNLSVCVCRMLSNCIFFSMIKFSNFPSGV